MTRRRAIGAACLLTAAAALLWRTRFVAEDVNDVVFLSLRVDGGVHATIERGEPVFLEVFLGGRTEGSSRSIGTSSTPWSQLVALRAGNDLSWGGAPLTLAPPRRMTISRENDGRPVATGGNHTIARIEGLRHLFVAELGLSPEVTARLPVGRHTIQASLDDGRWHLWRRAPAVSGPVIVDITESAAASDERRLERTARFYVRAGMFREARRIAEILLTRRTDEPAARILLGDALHALGETRDALRAYSEALQLMQNGRTFYEEPDALFAKIRAAERELATVKR